MKTISITGHENTNMGRLTKRLAEASTAYYNGGAAVMSDHEFDTLMEELTAMEQTAGYCFDISPSIRVGADVVTSLAKDVHETPALSLDKVKYADKEDLVTWLAGKKGFISWKMDGLTLVSTYKDGRLVKTVTRGNSVEGSVVTHNARYFHGLPVTIPYRGDLVVRSEATMSQAEFDRINEEADGAYENARNLASSTVQLYDSNEAKKREIISTAFELVKPGPEEGLASMTDRLGFLEKNGFNVVQGRLVGSENVLDVVEELKEAVSSLPFPTDGLVLTYEDQVYARGLGSTGKHPRGSVAMKWTDETVETRVTGIDWSVGRSGAITPVVVFETVRLGLGSNVSRASLHNISIMENRPSLDGEGTCACGIGSTVSVYLANMIIPQIAACTPGKVVIPDRCPVCGAKTVIRTVRLRDASGGEVKTLHCDNPACGAKIVKNYAVFASRDGANIEGVSESRIEDLVKKGLLRSGSPLDFYKLKDRLEVKRKDGLASCEGWGTKSVSALLEAIEKSRDIDLQHFLYALGIPLLGHDLSKKLDRYFHGNISEFMDFVDHPEKYPLEEEEGIGPVKAGNLLAWVDELHRDIDKQTNFRLLVSKMRFKEPEKPAADAVRLEVDGRPLTFVITGAVHVYANRDAFKQSVEARGGKVAGSVSKKTDFLVANDAESGTGKAQKAKELGVPVLTEDEFIARFGK